MFRKRVISVLKLGSEAFMVTQPNSANPNFAKSIWLPTSNLPSMKAVNQIKAIQKMGGNSKG